MKSVSVICVVFNEEHRIANFLRSFSWSNDIVLVDKSSTDNTVAVAKSLKLACVTVLEIPYTDSGTAAQPAVDVARNEWVLTITASDIIHPRLARRLVEIASDESFRYDCVAVPFSIYAFGIKNRRSPWYSKEKVLMFRKSALNVSDRVHQEYTATSNSCYHMGIADGETLSHLTHRDLATFLERHIRYTQTETNNYTDPKRSMGVAFRKLLGSVWTVVFRKKTVLLGWDGVALSLAFVSYAILEFLFVWQKFRGRGLATYDSLVAENLKLWQEEDDC